MSKLLVWSVTAVLCAQGIVPIVQGAPILFGSDLRPESEVGPFGPNGDPALSSDASGVALASFDPTTNEIVVFDLAVQGIALVDLLDLNAGGGIGTLHLHDGAPGENGDILLNIAFAADFSDVSGTLSLHLTSPLQFDPNIPSQLELGATSLDRLLAGNTYLNLHTNDFQSGEIRGQFFPDPTVIPEPITLALLATGVMFLLVIAQRRRIRLT